MKLFAIGFPKSGTTTLTVALRASGLRTVHWRDEDRIFVGAKIYDGLFTSGDPFAGLSDYDAITQADVCIPDSNINFWPNLDFAVLRAIRRMHPTCLLLLNYRRPEAICDSMMRWPEMQERFTESEIPGLPMRAGGSREHLMMWIENHFDACRHFFRDDPYFLEIDIESDDAPVKLGKALGMSIKDWGHYKPSETVANRIEVVRRADG